MKFYCIALMLILISIASGQSQLGNATENTTTEDTSLIASDHPQLGNATENTTTEDTSLIASDHPQLGNTTENTTTEDTSLLSPNVETNPSVQNCSSFDLDVKVMEIDNNAYARFEITAEKEDAKREMYKISIVNSGNIRIKDITVTAQMDKGMKLENTRYLEVSRGLLNVTHIPCEFKEETITNLSWDIGSMEPKEKKEIIVEAIIKPAVNNTNLTVSVNGYVGGDTLVGLCEDKAKAVYCNYKDTSTGQTCYDLSIDTCQIDYCEPWAMPK